MLLTISLLITSAASAQQRNVSIEGDHGKLAAILQTPDDRTNYPLVMLLHGFTSNKNTPILTVLADQLEAKRIASIRFDFNGHGESEGDSRDMTVPNEIIDAKCVYEYVSELPNVTSISVAGHSQGGVVTSMFAGELGKKKIKAVALLAPAAVLRDDAIRGNLFDRKYDSMNPPEYVEAPNGFKVGRNYFLTAQTLPIYETAAGYKGPACIVHGTGDTVVPYTYGIRYHDLWKGSELHLIPAFDHGFSQDRVHATQFATEFFAKVLLK